MAKKKGKIVTAPKGLPQKGGKTGKRKRVQNMPNKPGGRGFMFKGKNVF